MKRRESAALVEWYRPAKFESRRFCFCMRVEVGMRWRVGIESGSASDYDAPPFVRRRGGRWREEEGGGGGGVLHLKGRTVFDLTDAPNNYKEQDQ